MLVISYDESFMQHSKQKWHAENIATYLVNGHLDTSIPQSSAQHSSCCGLYSIDTQNRLSYILAVKKQSLINSMKEER